MSDEAKAKRKPANRNIGPRPAYVLVNLPEGVTAADIEVIDTTRKAEEALEAIDTGAASGYVRILVK
jgi:hypothetical protein